MILPLGAGFVVAPDRVAVSLITPPRLTDWLAWVSTAGVAFLTFTCSLSSVQPLGLAGRLLASVCCGS